jgi:hypothetical protein
MTEFIENAVTRERAENAANLDRTEPTEFILGRATFNAI